LATLPEPLVLGFTFCWFLWPQTQSMVTGAMRSFAGKSHKNKPVSFIGLFSTALFDAS